MMYLNSRNSPNRVGIRKSKNLIMGQRAGNSLIYILIIILTFGISSCQLRKNDALLSTDSKYVKKSKYKLNIGDTLKLFYQNNGALNITNCSENIKEQTVLKYLGTRDCSEKKLKDANNGETRCLCKYFLCFKRGKTILNLDCRKIIVEIN